MRTISAEALKAKGWSDGVILDVRTDMEHAEKHMACPHIHVPLDQLDPAAIIARPEVGAEKTLYILCRSGKRAVAAAEHFKAMGYDQCCVIEGGILSCESCGHATAGHLVTPAMDIQVEQKKPPMSLERQVRVAVGGFVALGAGLALMVDPAFALIALFFGCGLVFAGITDRCGLALILTYAPWNRMKKSCGAGACGCSGQPRQN